MTDVTVVNKMSWSEKILEREFDKLVNNESSSTDDIREAMESLGKTSLDFSVSREASVGYGVEVNLDDLSGSRSLSSLLDDMCDDIDDNDENDVNIHSGIDYIHCDYSE